MPWYYAGPDAKPVGPVSFDQLHALRAAGSLTADTFVIEHTGTAGAPLVWKRYAEAFPIPPAVPTAAIPPAPAAIPPATPAPHPLFPSATPAGYASTPPAPANKSSNGWCVWGFVLSLLSCLLALVCGIGLLPALISAVLCAIGLVQVMRNREQGGQGLAICGLIFSFLAIITAVLFIIFVDLKMFGHNGITVSEQTSNDAE
jgi:hypothetical protein